ncbi:ABC transporter substrate-binding protein [Salipiger abyssi]|uniref:ABC transporter substrate-binding protein n=1 Tax=Salipiger abyssi TaxID=1250539 RepID=UPI001A8CD816|nr:extracellular solute-binding protein [Salipiger abyssi]MBN9888953.1 extracellular solute-binding protein [Salipiger abyssi]
MTFNRRILLAGAASIALIAGALGSPALAQDRTELVVANSQWLDALRGSRLWAALEKYEEVNPEIDMVQQAVPYNEYADRLMTEMGAGQGPDMAIVQEGMLYTMADAGFLLPLDAAAEGIDLNVTNENGVIGGERLGIAWQRAVYALIHNDAILAKAGAEVPTDVDSLIAAAQAATEATGAIGLAGRHSMNEFNAWFMDFQNWAYGFGVNWVDADGNLTINTPEAITAVTNFAKAYSAGIMPIGDPMTTQRTRFKEEQVAFAIESSGGALNVSSGGEMPSTDLGASKLPFPEPGAHQQLFIVLSRHSEHPEAALDFIAWMLGDEAQQALRDVSGPDALATDVPVTEDFIASNPWAPAFAELAQNSRSTLIPGYEVETTSIMRIVMTAVEKVLLGAETAEDALAEAEAEIKADFN